MICSADESRIYEIKIGDNVYLEKQTNLLDILLVVDEYRMLKDVEGSYETANRASKADVFKFHLSNLRDDGIENTLTCSSGMLCGFLDLQGCINIYEALKKRFTDKFKWSTYKLIPGWEMDIFFLKAITGWKWTYFEFNDGTHGVELQVRMIWDESYNIRQMIHPDSLLDVTSIKRTMVRCIIKRLIDDDVIDDDVLGCHLLSDELEFFKGVK